MMKKQFKLMQGDNMESLKKLPDNSIDSVVSDPPYGLSFMGKKWDYDVPSVEFWKEVYRVLKPGGHVLSFGGTRTYHRMVVNIEDAGFEIRDQIMWLYGSGFPKSHNIGKAVDKLQGNEREVVGTTNGCGPSNNHIGGSFEKGSEDRTIIVDKGTSPQEGWGTALKPANEPICVARKPLSEKSVAENVLKWGTGGINIDGCRIAFEDTKNPATNPLYRQQNNYKMPDKGVESEGSVSFTSSKNEISSEGRFPANLIIECICDEVIKGKKGDVRSNTREAGNSFNSYDDKKGKVVTRIENYNDTGDIHTNPNCPCYMLDEQSGISKSNCKSGIVEGKDANVFNDGEKKASGHKNKIMVGNYNDKGGASRFFYIPKVSKKERNMGLDGFEEKTIHDDNNKYGIEKFNTQPKKNSHPTVKPVQLMAYLCRLVTPPNGIVLDPFMGSGSTGIAACLEGFIFVGMEMDENYFKIAEARIDNYEMYREFAEKKKNK